MGAIVETIAPAPVMAAPILSTPMVETFAPMPMTTMAAPIMSAPAYGSLSLPACRSPPSQHQRLALFPQACQQPPLELQWFLRDTLVWAPAMASHQLFCEIVQAAATTID